MTMGNPEMASQPTELTLLGAAGLIRARRLSSRELVQATLDRIASINPQINCFTEVGIETALESASKLDSLLIRGDYLGPLHGIPISLKDLIPTAGMRTTAGSPARRNWIPTEDAALVMLLKKSGAVIVGKTSTYEYGYVGHHAEFGDVRNPWNLGYTCGGSSSGSAASVAACMAFGSVGTDAAGSIRVPGALTGILALKPTYGQVTLKGVLRGSYTVGHAGPMARTGPDLRALLEALSDTSSEGVVERTSISSGGSEPLAGLCVGLQQRQLGELIDPTVIAAVNAAAAQLETLGARVVPTSLPDHALAQAVIKVIIGAEASEIHHDDLTNRPERFSLGLRAYLRSGQAITADTYIRAQRVRQEIQRQYADLMTGVDVLLLPTVPLTAWQLDATTVGDQSWHLDPFLAQTRYCPAANLTGQPALSVPCGFNSLGLPYAFQLMGRLGADRLLIDIADRYSASIAGPPQHPRITPQVAVLSGRVG